MNLLIIMSFLLLNPVEIRNMTTDSTVSFGTVDKLFNVYVGGATGGDGITYFTGENSCTNDCVVAPNTSFNLFYGLQNVQGCTATNSSNNSNWQGSVPSGGGTGDFSKLILGGISQTTTFNINCPVVALNNYDFDLIASETIELSFPANANIRLVGIANKLLIINIQEGSKTTVFGDFEEIVQNIFYTNYEIDKKENLSLNLNYDESFIMNPDIKIWMLITAVDPRNNRVDRALESGLCDVLVREPSLNISTKSIMYSNQENECILSPNKKYFLSKVYLK